MVRVRGIAAYQVTRLPRRFSASGLRWHAVPPAALAVVLDSDPPPSDVMRRLGSYRVTLVPSRTIDLTDARVAVAV